MSDICKTDITTIQRLLEKCADKIEIYAPRVSPDQDLVRRCRKMSKKLNEKKKL